MTIPFQAVKACRAERIALHVLELNPAKVRPALSFQAQWNLSRGIVRGVRENGELVEDHIAEQIAGGRVLDADERIVGADAMRRQVWTIEQHEAEYLAAHPDQRIAGMVGNGNLGSNPVFVGGCAEKLFHLRGEQQRFARHRYSCLAVWKHRVSVEAFDLSRPLPDGLECFTSGQRLVERGRASGTEEIVAMGRRMEFYDLRHLFLFGRIPRGDKRWMDIGLGAFWNNGELDKEAVARALQGEPVEVDIAQFGLDAVHEAMAAKDYLRVDEPRKPGEYTLHGGTMRVILREGIYPHNMIGIRPDGTVLSVVAGGLSNRAGLTIRGAAQLMQSLGAQDALLLDNGGDVMMYFDGRQVLGSAEGERSRLRSVLFFCCGRNETIGPLDARLITYARQPCAPLA